MYTTTHLLPAHHTHSPPCADYTLGAGEQITGIRDALYASVRALPWYTTHVLSMQPAAVPVEPAEDVDDVPAVFPVGEGFDEVNSARAVYSSFLSCDATEAKNWVDDTNEDKDCVMKEYNKMNIHYYIQRGQLSLRTLI